jgi:hypothetical protein
MRGHLYRIWNSLNAQSIGGDRYWQIALQNASSYKDMYPLINRYEEGEVLDLGAGRMSWRFTRYGGVYLAENAGFEVEEIVTNSGLFHLILNAPSILLSCFWAALRLNGMIPITTRIFLAVAQFLEKLFKTQNLFAMNHILILRKHKEEKLS